MNEDSLGCLATIIFVVIYAMFRLLGIALMVWLGVMVLRFLGVI